MKELVRIEFQSLQSFAEAALDELAASIAEGVLSPLLVRRIMDTLKCTWRRRYVRRSGQVWRNFRPVGRYDAEALDQIIENIQGRRASVREAHGFRALLEREEQLHY